jgi:threonine synthase
VICLDCDYDTAFDLCQEACRKFGWYNRNTAVNPFTGEGKKTAALEIACSLSKTPDAVICPVGDGCIISGLYKGFIDLKKLRLIDDPPRLYGVQAEGAAPVVTAFNNNADIERLNHAATLADSISVGYPRDGVKALRAVRNTHGGMISVSDDAILEAQRYAASKGGIFVEPAAAAAIAGLFKLKDDKIISNADTIVVLLTGHGLKDVDTVMRNVQTDIEIIKPDLDSVTERISHQDK